MMLHSAIHWPDFVDATLVWPMAVALSVYLLNLMPNMEPGLASVDVFTKVAMATTQVPRLARLGLRRMRSGQKHR